MWTATVNLVDGKPFGTFREAFIDFHARIIERLDKNEMSLHLLETACWIRKEHGRPLMFVEAKDIACEMGLLVGGCLVDGNL